LSGCAQKSLGHVQPEFVAIDASPVMKFSIPFLCAAAALSFSAFAETAKSDVVKPDLAKGADGNSTTPVNPKLAMQHPEYLVKQLHEFKSGKRDNAVMKGFASSLSDDDMRNIAFWLADQKAKSGFAQEKDLVRLGERIYRGGIADRQIAACAGCHSPNGAGIPAQYPRLSGQHAEYTSTQLKAFRSGERANSVQMTGVAAKMNDREIKAVSDYIAGLR
jgi:cytochrome c553